MFENFLALFTEKEQKEVVKVKPRVSRSLEHVLANAGRGKIIRGVDSYHLALVTIHKKGDLYLLGVQFERDADGEIFTERHDSMVESFDEAKSFFSKFGLGEINWIGGNVA
jgi:hypothetical protein